MRLSLWKLPVTFFLASFGLALLAQLPASVFPGVLRGTGVDVSAGGSAGTVWSGVLRGVRITHIPFGNVVFELSPLGLHLKWTSTASDFRSQGHADLGLGGRSELSDVEIVTYLDALGGDLPMSGRTEISIVSALFEGRSCQHADGTVMISGALSLSDRLPVRLSGPLECDAGSAAAALEGTIGPYPALLDVRSDDYTGVHLHVWVSEVSQDTGRVLSALGFKGARGQYELGQFLRLF